MDTKHTPNKTPAPTDSHEPAGAERPASASQEETFAHAVFRRAIDALHRELVLKLEHGQ